MGLETKPPLVGVLSEAPVLETLCEVGTEDGVSTRDALPVGIDIGTTVAVSLPLEVGLETKPPLVTTLSEVPVLEILSAVLEILSEVVTEDDISTGAPLLVGGGNGTRIV